MKYTNNLVYYILKTYEVEEKTQKIKSGCDVYKEELKLLKGACETVGITTANQLEILISNLEKELNGAFSIAEKCIWSIFLSTIFISCFAPAISEYLKMHYEIFIPTFMCFIGSTGVLLAISIFEVEVSEKFSYKGKCKKLLKMLCDINVLYYTKEESKNAE